MDQGTIVALVALAGSFATVLVTGAFGIWSKWIESEQKIKEHQLSLRSVYVTKKIEAGQSFISFNSIRINRTNIRDHYLRELKDKGIKNEELFKDLEDVEVTLNSIRYKEGNWTGLYFDIEELVDKSYKIIDELNESYTVCEKMLDKGDYDSPELKSIVVELLSINDRLQSVYRQMNIVIRNELAKYDVI